MGSRGTSFKGVLWGCVRSVPRDFRGFPGRQEPLNGVSTGVVDARVGLLGSDGNYDYEVPEDPRDASGSCREYQEISGTSKGVFSSLQGGPKEFQGCFRMSQGSSYSPQGHFIRFQGCSKESQGNSGISWGHKGDPGGCGMLQGV